MSDCTMVVGKKTAEEEDLVRHNIKKMKSNGDEVLTEFEEDETEDIYEAIPKLNKQTGPDKMEADFKQNKTPSTGILTEGEVPRGSRQQRISYMDSLMHGDTGMVLSSDEIVQMVTEEYDMEEVTGGGNTDLAPFNPKPVVDVSLEEYDMWCKSWKGSLIVKLLEKTIGYHAIETWIRRVLTRKGNVNVMDLIGDFFQVRFSDEGDCHALF
ncbi:Retrovirus-related Pol polyprotein [Arachis hypogaea]|uniref:Retrovirus-related Pol polyprotein n=1 Tax=Arachis hypogaea TaxID=3818 RepID=A0A6B9VC46_ARAHY|nr:Retrovirus-related Pol polyprotein [Arachis hypogaea]